MIMYTWTEIKNHTSPERKARMAMQIQEELFKMGQADQLRMLLEKIRIPKKDIDSWFDTQLSIYDDRTPYQVIEDGEGQDLIKFMTQVANNDL